MSDTTRPEELDDDALFAAILARKAAGDRIDQPFAILLSHWRRPALYVIRRIQQSYRRGGDDDQEELLQDAAIKLLERGSAIGLNA